MTKAEPADEAKTVEEFGEEMRSAGVSFSDTVLECRTKFPTTAAKGPPNLAGLTQDALNELARGYYLGAGAENRVEQRTFPFNAVVVDAHLDMIGLETNKK